MNRLSLYCERKKYFTLNSQHSIIRSVEITHIISNKFAAWHFVSDSVAETEVLRDIGYGEYENDGIYIIMLAVCSYL